MDDFNANTSAVGTMSLDYGEPRTRHSTLGSGATGSRAAFAIAQGIPSTWQVIFLVLDPVLAQGVLCPSRLPKRPALPTMQGPRRHAR